MSATIPPRPPRSTTSAAFARFVEYLAGDCPLVRQLLIDHDPQADRCAFGGRAAAPCSTWTMASLADLEVFRRRHGVDPEVAAPRPV